MDDAARRAREIACTCGGTGGHTVGYCPLALIGPAADALVASIATALREAEAERDKWKITSDAHALVIEQDLQPEIARLATRLARVEKLLAHDTELLKIANARVARVEGDAIRTLAAVLWSVGGHVVVKPATLVTLLDTDTVEVWDDPATGAKHYTVRAALTPDATTEGT